MKLHTKLGKPIPAIEPVPGDSSSAQATRTSQPAPLTAESSPTGSAKPTAPAGPSACTPSKPALTKRPAAWKATSAGMGHSPTPGLTPHAGISKKRLSPSLVACVLTIPSLQRAQALDGGRGGERQPLSATFRPPLGHTLRKRGQSPWGSGGRIHIPVLKVNRVGSDEIGGSQEIEAGTWVRHLRPHLSWGWPVLGARIEGQQLGPCRHALHRLLWGIACLPSATLESRFPVCRGTNRGEARSRTWHWATSRTVEVGFRPRAAPGSALHHRLCPGRGRRIYFKSQWPCVWNHHTTRTANRRAVW